MPNLTTPTNLYKIFVYGTLKRNEPNWEELINRNATFVGEATTVDKWPLIIATDLNMPFLLYKKNYGKNVHGEIYMIDQETKKFLDFFEAVDDKLYTLFEIDVMDHKSGSIHSVFTYMVDNFNPDLLNDKTILFESYSSKNSYFGEYRKSEDTPENTFNLLRQIKDINSI